MQTEDLIGGIYFLECPFTGTVRYVGQTSNFAQRKASYNSGQMSNKRMTAWFNGLQVQDLKPVFRMVYITDSQITKDVLETRFIEEYEDTVFNVRSGGFDSRLWRKTYKEQYFLSKR